MFNQNWIEWVENLLLQYQEGKGLTPHEHEQVKEYQHMLGEQYA